ncbi:hypothetical protein GOEFS_105_01130 [Gordonia effusa NBRC 100432]|uniref:Uncharacterized protein n=1 Tax=Gordonia effusa NBRC 100432 TaxID=1077974 RepID=H0R4V1_9ACTN|nr:hypothetical protein [Gordonia effusa]GAB20102.1 hypothetical protein GOEFS_105_01130 [Gordonia effusa NBRC 100432]
MTSPVPGPPKPGQHLASSVPTVSPEVVTQQVSELLAQFDEMREEQRTADPDGANIDLGSLDRQAALLEQAHQVLSTALEDVGRAT